VSPHLHEQQLPTDFHIIPLVEPYLHVFVAWCLLISHRSAYIYIYIYIYIWSRVSSGSIVSDKWLDDRAIGVRSPAEAKDFFSILCVQTGSGAHPASYPMGTAGPFPGGKARPGRDANHSPPSSAEVVNE
jgi:hypothetical protein